MEERKISTRRRAAVAIVSTLAAFSIACASSLPDPVHDRKLSQPGPHERVEVRLVFSEDADLDLYVTDPLLETVYFGNSPSRSGGTLAADVRCADPAPRTEIVTFPQPRPGRYRVGIEYAQRCRTVRGPTPYRVEINAKGSKQVVEGKIALGHLEPIVVEFDVAD